MCGLAASKKTASGFTHSASPSAHTSRFQMGTICLRRSIAYLQASNPSLRWRRCKLRQRHSPQPISNCRHAMNHCHAVEAPFFRDFLPLFPPSSAPPSVDTLHIQVASDRSAMPCYYGRCRKNSTNCPSIRVLPPLRAPLAPVMTSVVILNIGSPPVTGGIRATSSPSVSSVFSVAYSQLTDICMTS